ncbi:hypothetical protein CDD82_4629 [Ophiocordyceps australis]|uniref:BRCT domain-containing protein n=1 Tax=Ophiocordyceps australis TaxID=1399860 RepID=A0A2C5Z5F4_9HYPO|nr:hypothetical protein CDD82_4629 [Ophiocordyceps australis]
MSRMGAIVYPDAVDGDSQTLDSQAVLDAHRALFGIAKNTGGNLPPACPNATNRGALERPLQRGFVDMTKQSTTGQTDDEVMADAGESLGSYSLEKIAIVDSTPLEDSLAQHGENKGTMESSQASPTQLMQYAHGNEPSHASQPHSDGCSDDEPHTLCEDDTGAVRFSILDGGRSSSPVTQDGGLDTTRGDWRKLDVPASQLQSNSNYTPCKSRNLASITPEQSRNPFASKANASAPLTATQLFRQTQQVNTVNGASPTSSRPSPVVKAPSVSSPFIHTSPLKTYVSASSPSNLRAQQENKPVSSQQPANDTVGGTPRAEECVPESPKSNAPNVRASRRPLTNYEPMKKSQERKLNKDKTSHGHFFSDDDSFSMEQKRREKVKRMRAQAGEEMDKVSFTRAPRRESMEKPCRKKRRFNDATPRDPCTNQAPSRDAETTHNSSRPCLPSFGPPSAESAKISQGQDVVMVDETVPIAAPVGDDAETQGTDEDLIPATSPVPCSSAKAPQSVASITRPELQDSTDLDAEMHFSPEIRQPSLKTYGCRTRRSTRMNPFLDSSGAEVFSIMADEDTSNLSNRQSTTQQADAARESLEPEAAATEETGRKSDSKSKSHGRSKGRSETRRNSLRTPRQPPASSSDLTTPGTLDSLASIPPRCLALGSPEHSKDLRKRTLKATTKSASPHGRADSLRMSTRSCTRALSESTDELQCINFSPQLSLFENTATSRLGKSSRTSTGTSNKNGGLFEGMAFAITSRLDQPELRQKLESQIILAGGWILKEGFEELFGPSAVAAGTSSKETSSMDCKLKLSGAHATRGFTALISDGHSRTPKFLQALALDLPCLAHQWVTSCVEKGQVVDWMPYLLCAGSSSVLGNAMRSRSLTRYSAGDARLCDRIERRPRLLEGQSVLAVVAEGKKTGREATSKYMFLVQALGPHEMCKVTTVQQAGERLRKRRFDWIYVDKAAGSADGILAGQEKTAWRKRKLEAARSIGVRVLTDELLVQSLILGRMLETGERDGVSKDGARPC